MKCASTVTLVVVLVALSQLLLIVYVLNALSMSASKDQIPPCDFEYSAAWFITPTPQPPVITRIPRTSRPKKFFAPSIDATDAEGGAAESPAPIVDDGLPLKIPPFEVREFGTVSNVSFSTVGPSVVTEAYCDCYEGSCTLFLKNAVIKRVSPGRIVVRATPESNRDRLEEVLRSCRNDYPFCEPSHSSVYCSGIQFELSSRVNNQVIFEDRHIMLTARRLGWEFYAGLVYPRGLFLNWALLRHATERICGNVSNCMSQLKTSVFLTTDHRRTQWVSPIIVHVQSVLQFPESSYFALRTQQSARWISFNNRILSYDGRIRNTVAAGINVVLRNASEERSTSTAAPVSTKQEQSAPNDQIGTDTNSSANTGTSALGNNETSTSANATQQASINATANDTDSAINTTSELVSETASRDGANTSPRTNGAASGSGVHEGILKLTDQPVAAEQDGSGDRSEPQPLSVSAILVMYGKKQSKRTRREDQVKASLATKLPVITGKRTSTLSDADWGKMTPPSQFAFFASHSMFLVDEVHMTWMLFAPAGSSWVLPLEYRHGYDLPTIGLHIRTWLLRRNCRLVVYVYWEEPQRAEPALFAELARPYSNEISVVFSDSVIRCDSLLTCGNLLDYSLVLDTRGYFES